MMKKMWFMLASIALAFNASGAKFIQGQQYIQLDRPLNHESQVLEFFSFYCPPCYKFEQVYRISSMVKKSLPPGVKMTKYHVDFLGPMSKELTKAWAVAITLGIEDKIEPILFDGLQKTQTIKTLDDIRTVFIKAGIDAEKYDSTWKSFIVKSLVIQQEKAATNIKLHSVPTLLINGKYVIKNDGLDMSSMNTYIKQFTDIVNFLLNQK